MAVPQSDKHAAPGIARYEPSSVRAEQEKRG
jgi:hypothetical protein